MSYLLRAEDNHQAHCCKVKVIFCQSHVNGSEMSYWQKFEEVLYLVLSLKPKLVGFAIICSCTLYMGSKITQLYQNHHSTIYLCLSLGVLKNYYFLSFYPGPGLAFRYCCLCLCLLVSIHVCEPPVCRHDNFPDCKVHGAKMGLIWGRQDPGGAHDGPMIFAIWVITHSS